MKNRQISKIDAYYVKHLNSGLLYKNKLYSYKIIGNR
jgi:hypothetical protein